MSNQRRTGVDGESNSSDLVIVLLGPIGAGKSTFVSELCDQVPGAEVMDDFHHSTAKLQQAILPASEVRSLHPDLKEHRLILLDTPGIENTYTEDLKLLTRLGEWLTSSSEQGRVFVGLVYLSPIYPFKMTHEERRNLELLPKLFGGPGFSNSKIFPVSSHWNSQLESVCQERERELSQKYWGQFLPADARPQRFVKDGQSARAIVTYILDQYLKNKDDARYSQEVYIQQDQVEGNRRPHFMTRLLTRQRRPIEATQRKIVLIMGETGVGKSAFVNDLAGDIRAAVNDNLQGNPTIDYHDVPLIDGEGTSLITFVDCPGYNNTDKSDRQINSMIREFLEESPSLFSLESRIIGVVCLIDASNRFVQPAEWHTIFTNRKLTCPKILAVTHRNNWSHIQAGISSLQGLRVIKAMVSNGARIEPFRYRTNGYAQGVLRTMFEPNPGDRMNPTSHVSLGTFLDKVFPS